MSAYFNSGPIPPQNNPIIRPNYYRPSVFNIAALTLGNTTTVQTNTANNYVQGQQIRFIVPSFYGTRQLNEQTAFITAIIDTTQFVVNINSNGYSTFIASPPYTGQIPAQVMAIGDINNNSTSDNLSISGAFQNISPG